MSISVGVTLCPNCNTVVDIKSRWSLLKSKIGTPTFYVCKHCGGQYSDGKKEWPEMKTFEKVCEIIRFIIVDILIMLVAGLVVMLATAIIANSESNKVWGLSFFISAFVVLALCIFLNIRKVLLSKKRFSEK